MFKCSQRQFSVSFFMDEKIDFNLVKIRSKSKRHRDLLLDAMLDADDESREVKRGYQLVKDRVHKALLMSDKKIAHEIAKNISDCKKARSERSKKIRTKEKWYYDGGEYYKSRISGHQQDEMLDDEKHYLKTDYNKKKVCQSIWCNSCRYMASKTFETKINDRLSRGMIDPTLIGEDFYRRQKALRRPYRNDDLLHITGVVGICKLDTGEVSEMLKKDTNRWRQVRYLLRKTPSYQERWIEVSYEFELVNWRHLLADTKEGSEFKKKQMKQLIDHYGIKSDLFVFVHFHGVTNLTRKQLKIIFEKKYFVGKDRLMKTDVDTGLYIQSLYKDKSLKENIRKISSYNFKNAVRFKHNFRGKSYTNGEFFSDYELSELIILYHNIQKRSWRGLLRSCDNDWSVEAYETELRYENARRSGFRGYFFDWQRDVMVVDYYGNVSIGNWDPDNLIKNHGGISVNWISNKEIYEKIKIGREYFLHPHMPWLEVYKNVYEYRDTGKNYRFDTFKEAFVWYNKNKRYEKRGSKTITLGYKAKRLGGWDYDICDDGFPEVMRKMMIFERISEFEKIRLREKKKRGHITTSNYGPSRGRDYIGDREKFQKELIDNYNKTDVVETEAIFTATGEVVTIEVARVKRKPVRNEFDHWWKIVFGIGQVDTNYDVDMNDVGNIEFYSVTDYPLYLFLLGHFIDRDEVWYESGDLFGLRFNKLISQNQK